MNQLELFDKSPTEESTWLDTLRFAEQQLKLAHNKLSHIFDDEQRREAFLSKRRLEDYVVFARAAIRFWNAMKGGIFKDQRLVITRERAEALIMDAMVMAKWFFENDRQKDAENVLAISCEPNITAAFDGDFGHICDTVHEALVFVDQRRPQMELYCDE